MVVVAHAFMVLRTGQGHYFFAVRESKNGKLFTLQEFFHHDFKARIAENLFIQHL